MAASRIVRAGNSSNTQLATKSQTLSGNNTTVATAIFGVTGSVEVTRLWGVVTTTIGANHTAAAWRLNDQTAQLDITASSGAVLSAFTVGSLVLKKSLLATAAVAKNAVAGAVTEPTTTETIYFSPIVLTKKTGATTNIEYVYATTDTPTSGVIQHFVEWRPISADGALVAL